MLDEFLLEHHSPLFVSHVFHILLFQFWLGHRCLKLYLFILDFHVFVGFGCLASYLFSAYFHCDAIRCKKLLNFVKSLLNPIVGFLCMIQAIVMNCHIHGFKYYKELWSSFHCSKQDESQISDVSVSHRSCLHSV